MIFNIIVGIFIVWVLLFLFAIGSLRRALRADERRQRQARHVSRNIHPTKSGPDWEQDEPFALDLEEEL